MNNRKYAVVGGDFRAIEVANSLARAGYSVMVYGINSVSAEVFDPNIILCETASRALLDSNIIILPLPMTTDNEYINTPLSDRRISIDEVFSYHSGGKVFLGGKIGEKVKNMAKTYSAYVLDYMERDELTIQNAVPTAEGAIQIAMEEMPVTLHNSQCLIIGYGRIGKVLSKMLDGIGAHVTCSARKHSDMAYIKSMGYQCADTARLSGSLEKFDLIINTVPAKVLEESILKQVKKSTLIIDLASKPGGVDFETAKELGLNTIWALSLPGKVAPVTAGRIIYDTIENMIEELWV